MRRADDQAHSHEGHSYRDDEDDRLAAAPRGRMNCDEFAYQLPRFRRLVGFAHARPVPVLVVGRPIVAVIDQPVSTSVIVAVIMPVSRIV